MTRHPIQTGDAPQAIGSYSQAMEADGVVYLSGQIGLDPKTMELADGFEAQARQVFSNLRAVAAAAGCTLEDAVKLTVFLADLGNFAKLNAIMADYLGEPYPARSALEASQLPKGALIEIDAVLVK